MWKKKLLIAPVAIVAFCFVLVLPAIFIFHERFEGDFESYDLSSTANLSPYGSIEPLKKLFVDQVASKFNSADLMTGEKLDQILVKYNDEVAPRMNSNGDTVDALVELLPKSYRRHFSLIHRSFSIQKATPLSPRVILYGPDAKVMMTFNGGKDVDGAPLAGGESIEIIEWNTKDKTWDFSEITFDSNKKALHNKNPQKCVMCHAGTPKPANFANIGLYKGKLKPIFPQYPFWPGFYGSVNDIVGLDSTKDRNGNVVKHSIDTIMRDEKATLAQIRGLTFADTEELFRLRHFLDTNPKYLNVVRNELSVHTAYFTKFIDSTKERSRYRHLITLKELYKDNLAVPEYLRAAPYRRTFDREYGHYLLRPNFYLSSLLTFYHSQFIAKEIEASPVYQKIKNSFLARKYNCNNIQTDGIKLSDLDQSFDLLYPNVSSKESMDRQYLLAYQYNIEAAAKKSEISLPLFAWNLESNEDIASYHYGNVFSDLNEVVLWRLASGLFPQLKPQHSRSAAEGRHYEFANSNFLQEFLDQAGGRVSKMNNKEFKFANSSNSYYGTTRRFNALPASAYCDSVFLPAAQSELKNLASLKATNQLPHQIYVLNSQLMNLNDILEPGMRPGLNMVRQACETCHTDNTVPEKERIDPRINVDWFSDTYHEDIKELYTRMKSLDQNPAPLKDVINEVLSPNTLPVPYGNGMPFARRPMDDFALKCEMHVIHAQYASSIALKGKSFGCDRVKDPNSFGCRCQKLSLRKINFIKSSFLANSLMIIIT